MTPPPGSLIRFRGLNFPNLRLQRRESRGCFRLFLARAITGTELKPVPDHFGSKQFFMFGPVWETIS
jgi:hypothetical protein